MRRCVHLLRGQAGWRAVFDKDVCMQLVDDVMKKDPEQDCTAGRGKGGCADAYIFSEGKQVGDNTILGQVLNSPGLGPVYATCCVAPSTPVPTPGPRQSEVGGG